MNKHNSDTDTDDSVSDNSGNFMLIPESGAAHLLWLEKDENVKKRRDEKEKKRGKILKQVELSSWCILSHTRGTCLEGILLAPLFWISMALYVGMRMHARVSDDVPDQLKFWENSEISVLGGFLSFFLVLFVNQTNIRFLQMYGLSKACGGRIQDIAALASTQFPKDLAEQIVRHVNAAHIAGYVGLDGPSYNKRNFFDHYNYKHKLITPEEMKQLAHHTKKDPEWSGPGVMKELVIWCNRDVGVAKKKGYIDSIEAKDMHDRILQFRAAMDGIYNYCEQPPHFFYIHFLCLLSTFYLPIFAIDNALSAGWGDNTDWLVEILNGCIVFVQCIFVIGLRLLGQKMVNPYGDDNEDLRVTSYVEATLNISKVVIDIDST